MLLRGPYVLLAGLVAAYLIIFGAHLAGTATRHALDKRALAKAETALGASAAPAGLHRDDTISYCAGHRESVCFRSTLSPRDAALRAAALVGAKEGKLHEETSGSAKIPSSFLIAGHIHGVQGVVVAFPGEPVVSPGPPKRLNFPGAIVMVSVGDRRP